MEDTPIPAIYFSNATREVFNTMIGCEIIEVKAYSDSYEDVPEQITGFLNVTGDMNMMVSIAMSRKTACALMVYMTGMQLSEVKEEDTYDGVAEIVNMIVGQLRIQTASMGLHLKALIPFVAAGDNYRMIYKNKVESLVKRFRMGNLDFLLKVSSYRIN